MNRTPLPLALAALAIAALAPPAPARASVPGNEDQLARSGLQHVCVDLEPGDEGYVACNEQEGGDPTGFYTGSECVTAGLPPTCVVDYVPKTELKAKLFLIEDEDAADNEGELPVGRRHRRRDQDQGEEARARRALRGRASTARRSATGTTSPRISSRAPW